MSTMTLPRPATRPRLMQAGVEPYDLDRRLRAGRALVIDTRPAVAFDAGHIPLSVNAPDDRCWDAVAALLPPDAAVAIVGATAGDARSGAGLLADALPEAEATVVSGGIERWRRLGLRTDRGLALDARRAVQQVHRGGVALIDVRPAADFAAGHVVGAISVPLDEWGSRARALPRLPLVVAASSSEPAATAASLFRAAGHGCVWRVDGGGIEEMLDAGATLPVR